MITFELEDIMEAIEESTGFCADCGEPSGFAEPDMRRGKCDACGQNSVYGAEELVVMGLVQ